MTTEKPAADAPGTDPTSQEQIRERVVTVLQSIYDPEIPINIYDLGLIYDIDINEAGEVSIRMTLTSPACPAAGSLPPEVETRVFGVDGVSGVKVEVVWDPPWTPERISEAARLELGID